MMDAAIIYSLIFILAASRIEGTKVVVSIPEGDVDARLSKIMEMIANVTKQERDDIQEERDHWLGLDEKLNELLDARAPVAKPKPAPTSSPMPTIPQGEIYGIRLVDSSGNINYRAGRLEIRHNGIWGTVCDDGSGEGNTQADHHIGKVVCHMLGFERARGYTTSKSSYGQVNVPSKIWLDNVKCTGSEETIYECTHASWGIENCEHDEDVGVYCN